MWCDVSHAAPPLEMTTNRMNEYIERVNGPEYSYIALRGPGTVEILTRVSYLALYEQTLST